MKSINNNPKPVEAIAKHSHTKSYKALGGSSLQVSSSNKRISMVNRNSSVNPYIQNIGKTRIKEALSNSAVINESEEKKPDVMQELLEDFDKKNKAMATTRDKKEVSSPQTFKGKKQSVNPP